MALVHKCITKQNQELFTLAIAYRGARIRRAAGEKCPVMQNARNDIRKYSIAVRSIDLGQLTRNCENRGQTSTIKRKLKGLAA